MKRLTLLLALILAGYLSSAQECGSYIELIGTGMAGKSEATLHIDDLENVQKIIVEAVYKSTTAPTTITFSSSLPQSVDADAVVLDISGSPLPYTANVYRAELKPAETVTIQAGLNKIFSFSAYVYRKGKGIASSLEGELYHVFENGNDPLVIDIPLSPANHSRNVNVRFGITELDNDSRYAIFRLKAGEETEEIVLEKWDAGAGELDSYTIQEVEFEDVAENIDEIEMTLISPLSSNDGTGDSFIAGVVVVDVPCEYEELEGYCSYTQGFYGNAGGKTCAGETTRELLTRLLDEDLVMGDGDNIFTIPAGGVDCVIDILPGGGPSKVLDGPSSCGDLGNLSTNKQGRIKNTLLAQGITLALNLLNSPDLAGFPVDGELFITRLTEDCTDPESKGIEGTEQSYAFNQELVDFLGSGATIADLLDLVNRALGSGGNISPLSLSQLADAANMVNEAFDECVVVLVETSEDLSGESVEVNPGNTGAKGIDESLYGEKGVTSISDLNDGNAVGIYPNPVSDRLYISLPSGTSYIHSVAIYNITGLLLDHMAIESVTGKDNTFEVDAGHLTPGIYILKVDTGEGSFSQRFGMK